MVRFGEELHKSSKADWARYYIDYNELKKKLKELRRLYQTPNDGWSGGRERAPTMRERAMSRSNSLVILVRRNSGLPAASAAVDALEDDFARFLDAEVEKVVLFFLQEQGALAKKMLEALRDLDMLGGRGGGDANGSGSGGGGGSAGSLLIEERILPKGAHERALAAADAAFLDIGGGCVDLLRFLQLNVAALRKILKKHDKQARDRLLACNYLSSRARAKYSFLQQLYHNEGLLALVASLRTGYEEVHSIRLGGELRGPSGQHSLDTAAARTPEQRRLFDRIEAAQQQLQQEQRRTVQDYLSLSSDLLLEAAYAQEEPRELAKKRALDKTSAIINLATTFLYMTNYYIVGPSSTEYAAALGGSPAVSGVIIGMTPIAACFSCILYSWWSNSSFKQPLVCCCLLLTAGNFLYGLALSYDAFWMVLLGRLLIGLGGARGVNRRYIADTIPLEQRTYFSAAFVAVGAVGMAFGPFVAAVLAQFEFNVGILIMNGMTSPGWFMFVSWSFLGLLTLCFFKEPEYRFRPLAKPLAATKRKVTPPPSTRSSGRSSGGGSGTGFVAAGGGSGKVSYGALAGGLEEASAATTPGASRSLLSIHSDVTDEGTEEDDLESFLCCGVLPLPLVFTLLCYFVNKLVTEAVVSAAPLLTEYMFDWGITGVGILMAMLGLVVLPVNVIVGRLSLTFDDRWLMQMLSVVTCVGCLVILEYSRWWPYTEGQYIAGVFLIFVALQAHEGVIMSITSKIIPPELAKGTFNSGFLATEAGTFARFVGDASITILGMASIDTLLTLLYVPCLLLCAAMVGGTWLFYPVLDV